MRYISLFASLIFLCHCNTYKTAATKNSPPDTLITLIAWGLPDFANYDKEMRLAHKYGFTNQEMGCTISDQEIDSFIRYNEIAERPIVAKYGKNWKVKYKRELRAIIATPEECCYLIHFTQEVFDKRKERSDSLFYHFEPTKHRGIYNVEVVGYQQKTWVSFFRYHLNYIEEKVTLKRKSIKTSPSYLSNNYYFSDDTFTATPR